MKTANLLTRISKHTLRGLAAVALMAIAAAPIQVEAQGLQVNDIEIATGNAFDGQLSAPGEPIYASELNDERNLQIILHNAPNTGNLYKVTVHIDIRDENGKLVRDPFDSENPHTIVWEERTVNASGLMKGYAPLRLMPGIYTCQVQCNDILLKSKQFEILRKPGEASHISVNGETSLTIHIPAEGGINELTVNTDGKHYNIVHTTANIGQRSTITQNDNKVVIETRPNYTHQTIETHIAIEADGLSVPVTFVQSSANTFSSSAWMPALRNMIDVGSTYTRSTAFKGEDITLKDHYVVMHWENLGMWFFGRVAKNNDARIEGIYLSGKLDEHCIFGFTSVYTGKFSKNKMSEGSCYDRLGNLIYQGAFKDGKAVEAMPNQLSFYPSKVDINRRFEYIEEGKGAIYLGETYNGKKEGYGIYVWRNGDCWVGLWKDDASVEGCYIENSGFGAKRNRFEEN